MVVHPVVVRITQVRFLPVAGLVFFFSLNADASFIKEKWNKFIEENEVYNINLVQMDRKRVEFLSYKFSRNKLLLNHHMEMVFLDQIPHKDRYSSYWDKVDPYIDNIDIDTVEYPQVLLMKVQELIKQF